MTGTCGCVDLIKRVDEQLRAHPGIGEILLERMLRHKPVAF